MAQISKKLRSVEGPSLSFWCAGCDMAHTVGVGPNGWRWNGDADRPVFSSSVLVTGVQPLTDKQHAAWMSGDPLPTPTPLSCHSFVGSADGSTPGRIQYLGDCTHALTSQTVDLADWPARYKEGAA